MKTIEEKAKAYDEAVERAKQIRNGNPSSGTAIVVCEQIFPELAESEDERIRKWLIDDIKRRSIGWTHSEFTGEQILAWLEKQKEQKPVEDRGAVEPTPKQNYSGLTDFERAIHRGFLCAGVENVPVTIIKETAQECMAAWSEEDEKLLRGIEQCVYDNVANIGTMNKVRYIDWLKSLRPQPKQEWSEEDDVMFNTAKKIIWESEASEGTTNKVISWLGGKLRSLRHQPKQEWSEEDERILAGIIGKIDHDQTYGVSKAEMLSLLNRFRPSWKPSKEQMEALHEAVIRSCSYEYGYELGNLELDLKTL